MSPVQVGQKILKTNPDSFISIDVIDGQFKRRYIFYGACSEGFQAACRALLFLGGTFLKDRYENTLLATTTYDNNNRLFSLAFCACDIEDEGNWDWFLRVWDKCCMKIQPSPIVHTTNQRSSSIQKRGYYNQLTDIFLMRCTHDMCSI